MDLVTQNIEISPFLAWLAWTSLQGSVLICLILLVQKIGRGKLPVRWCYCFWLLLLVRLALPWAPQSSMSVFNLLGGEPAKVVLDDGNGGSKIVGMELPMVTPAASEEDHFLIYPGKTVTLRCSHLFACKLRSRRAHSDRRAFWEDPYRADGGSRTPTHRYSLGYIQCQISSFR